MGNRSLGPNYKSFVGYILSAAERRGTPVLLSALVSDNSGNSPQVAALRRTREIDQSSQRFHVGYDNRAIFVLTPNGIGDQLFFPLCFI